MHKEIQMHSL